MDITRNGQTVTFQVNTSGDLEQVSPYVSKAGDANREYVAYLVENVIVIAQDKFLARQALKQHRVELVEAMRAELAAEPETPTDDEDAYANDDAMFGDAETEPQSTAEAAAATRAALS